MSTPAKPATAALMAQLMTATRSGDTDEKKALDEYEATLLVRLKAAYAKGDIDPSVHLQMPPRRRRTRDELNTLGANA